MTPEQRLTQAIKTHAHALGFDLCRILALQTNTVAPHADFFEGWLDQARAGEMTYLARHTEKRRYPARLAESGPAFRSMLVLGIDYHQLDLPVALRDDPSRGLIASYAWGDDYHELIRPQLYALDEFIRSRTGRTTQGKCLVDTGPVLERDWAQQAGLGFFGKNCCTIAPGRGSWLFLAVILIPEELTYDPPPRWIEPGNAGEPETLRNPDAASVLAGLPRDAQFGAWQIPSAPFADPASDKADATQTGTCGACTRCLSACPTDAFIGPFHLDPQRCISYWTIEAQEPVPRELRPHFGNRIFGCDICQEVCPWNHRLPVRAPAIAGLRAQQDRIAPPLLEGFAPDTPYWLHQDAFNLRFRRSPIRRAKRRGMLRNVCIALGNWGKPDTLPALTAAVQDAEPLARGHAAWALGQVLRATGGERVRSILLQAQTTESDLWVRAEIHAALTD